MGKPVAPAVLTQIEPPPVAPVIDVYDQDFTLSQFRSDFNVDTHDKSILVTIKNRGASQILVFFNEGTPGPVTLTEANEVFQIQSTKFDYAAAEMVEKYHVIVRESTAAGVLSIICHEPLTPITNTVVNIKTIELPMGTSCAHECGQGTCESGVCKCNEGFFGKSCTKDLKLMDNQSKLREEVVTVVATLQPYNTFSIALNVTIDDEILIDLRSKENPISTLLAAESDEFVARAIMRRDKQDRHSLISELPKLKEIGRSQGRYYVEKQWVFLTLQNHEAQVRTLEVNLEGNQFRNTA